MSWYQCSTCGDLFPSSGALADHKRRNHWANVLGCLALVAALFVGPLGLADCEGDDYGPKDLTGRGARP